MVEWDLPVGAELTRDERRLRYGGALYGGIEPSRRSSNVFVYSDPSRGGRYGYNFDGWVGDEFLFTGEGRVGSQQLKDGNRAIASHADDGRALRLFVANGNVPGSGVRRQLYLGEFALNPLFPYFTTEAPDSTPDLRQVFVFRLQPVGECLRRAVDSSASGLPPSTPEVSEALPGPIAQEVDPEGALVTTFERKASEPVSATRREAELVARFREHLERLGHTVRGYKIRPAGEYSTLRVDLLDVTDEELFEAKGVTNRDSVRLAIGQLMDYGRFVPARRNSILLPSRPSEDLLDLLAKCEIGCVYESPNGDFVRV